MCTCIFHSTVSWHEVLAALIAMVYNVNVCRAIQIPARTKLWIRTLIVCNLDN